MFEPARPEDPGPVTVEKSAGALLGHDKQHRWQANTWDVIAVAFEATQPRGPGPLRFSAPPGAGVRRRYLSPAHAGDRAGRVRQDQLSVQLGGPRLRPDRMVVARGAGRRSGRSVDRCHRRTRAAGPRLRSSRAGPDRWRRARPATSSGCSWQAWRRCRADDGVLVLDDVHHIKDPLTAESLALFVQHLPPWLHVVIAARTDPSIPLDRLRVRGQLVEVRFAELRFTRTRRARSSPASRQTCRRPRSTHPSSTPTAGLQVCSSPGCRPGPA